MSAKGGHRVAEPAGSGWGLKPFDVPRAWGVGDSGMHKEAIELLCDSGGAGPVPRLLPAASHQQRVSAPPAPPQPCGVAGAPLKALKGFFMCPPILPFLTEL